MGKPSTDGDSVSVSVGGFIQAESGWGDRYGDAHGDDETYIIAESTLNLGDRTAVYLDYSEADELDIKIYRPGLDYKYNPHTIFSFEFSEDDLVGDDIESLDFRVALYY